MDSKPDVYTFFMSVQIFSKSEGKSKMYTKVEFFLLKSKGKLTMDSKSDVYTYFMSTHNFKKRGKIDNFHAQKT